MLVQYVVKLRDPIILEDHWPISVMGGHLRAISRDNKVIGFEISFSGQPVHFAPAAEVHDKDDIKYTISMRDKLLPFVQMHLEDAFSYLQCYFDIEILIGEIEARYQGETEDEENQIKIKSFRSEKQKYSPIMPYDIFTRALMAAETGRAPTLAANFLTMARSEVLQERYIDSFRYSFLLIEAVYGDGKYRAAQMKEALKSSTEFTSIVSNAFRNPILQRQPRNTDTDTLLSTCPSVEDIIDHIVDKRGFYFHGNVKRSNAWKPK